MNPRNHKNTMKTKPLTERQKNEIRDMNRRLTHRPMEERAEFIGSFCKIRLTTEELRAIVEKATAATP